MAHGKVSQMMLALAMLVALTSAVPQFGLGFSPLNPFGFGGGLPGVPLGHGGPKVGSSYACRASYGACAKSTDEPHMVWVKDPTMLAGVTRVADHKTGEIQGMTVSITDPSTYARQQSSHASPFHGGQFGLPGFGGQHAGGLFGGPYQGAAGLGGFGLNKGFLGALGAFGPHSQGNELEMDLKIKVNYLPHDLDVVLVFTRAADSRCTPEYSGPVLIGPDNGLQRGGGHGAFGLGLGLGGGLGNGFANPFGGFPVGGRSIEDEFGVIARLTIKEGHNSFKVNGLGRFTKLRDLAGRQAALCENVVQSVDGGYACTGKTYKILFCAKLAYAIDAPELEPNEYDDHHEDHYEDAYADPYADEGHH